MIRRFVFMLLYFVPFLAYTQEATELAIIPQPVLLEKGAGSFKLAQGTTISFPEGNKELSNAVDEFTEKLLRASGIKLAKTGTASASNAIVIELINDTELGP